MTSQLCRRCEVVVAATPPRRIDARQQQTIVDRRGDLLPERGYATSPAIAVCLRVRRPEAPFGEAEWGRLRTLWDGPGRHEPFRDPGPL